MSSNPDQESPNIYGEDIAEFERLIKEAQTGQYKLRLFVSGSSPRSQKAIANIHAICEEYLAGRYELEVVDLYQRPDLARGEQVFAAPTLIKDLPEPVRKVVGDMSDEDKVLYSLNIVKP